MDRRAPRARPRAPRLLWLRHRLPVLRRSGARPWPRRPRSGRRSPLPPPMNDLRARIAAIVERDRSLQTKPGGERGSDVGTDRNPLYAMADPPASGRYPIARGSSVRADGSVSPFVVHEKRIALDDLGLEIVGRGACDPLLVAHLGLKGDPPERWQDVLFLDTETTGLSGGTGTYIFLIGVAHFAEKELILRQHLLLDLGAEP